MSETKEFKQYRKKTCPYCGSSQINWIIIEPEKDCDGDAAPNFVVEEKCCNCEKVIKTTELYGDNTILETVNESDSNPDIYKDAWQKLSDTYDILLTNYNALKETHKELIGTHKELIGKYTDLDMRYKEIQKKYDNLHNAYLSTMNCDENVGVCSSDDEKTVDYEAVIKTKDRHIEELEHMSNTFLEEKQMWEGKYKSLLQDVEWLIHRLRTGEE